MKKLDKLPDERSLDEKIYDALDKLEKVALKLSGINKILKKERKKSKKKAKKRYKLNKNTGALVMKKAKKCKSAKLMKR